MTGVNTAALLGLKTPVEKKTASWSRLDLHSLHPGTYMAADPSFSAFGLVLFEVMPDRDEWCVHMAQTLATGKIDATGWEETYRRTEQLQARLAVYVQQWVVGVDWGTVYAVNEAPPIGGGKMNRPEASQFGGYAFRQATQSMHRLPMVRKQDHAYLLCGDRNASKSVHHAQLKAHLPMIRGGELITNEALRDALSVAMCAAHREP